VEERKRSKRWRIAMKAVEWILRQLRSLSPYLAVELLLPGGSIVALLLWTYRHRTAARSTAMRSLLIRAPDPESHGCDPISHSRHRCVTRETEIMQTPHRHSCLSVK
jgi:hypothetical protein